MPLVDDMTTIELRLKAAGKSVSGLCIEAAIARSTWDRWKRGETEPNTKTWRAVLAAVDAISPLSGDLAA